MNSNSYDCIIGGGGHAGCEAAIALAKLGIKTLLISGNLDRLGYLSCNPAIGGLAKGHMVREIDALGGQMGKWADAAAIQYRTLNLSKGPAVRATRAQMDRVAYQQAVKKTLFSQSGLEIWQDNITEIKTANGKVTGIKTQLGIEFNCKNVLLTTGTFLNGKIHIGLTSQPSGRLGDAPVTKLSDSLRDLGITLGRLKTGTTPRLLKSSINFSMLEEQPGEIPIPRFSFNGAGPHLPQISCHITWTNKNAHEIIRSGFGRSPLFTGIIEGTGARYCPSIEDKVARFPDRERHHIFLEPEGLESGEIYANGISTSLPLDIQIEMIHAIKGLEKAQIVRPGYAIEYDYANPLQLWPTLQSKIVPGLWMAGQINGTSGYEEAAAQGLWAALNIAALIKEKEPFLPGRHTSYMAVLVDDLVTLGTEEPYRMFTSRAEHRLLLREDNADMRMTPLGREYGLVDDKNWENFCIKKENTESLKALLETSYLPLKLIKKNASSEIKRAESGKSLSEVLRRPDVTLENIEYALANYGNMGQKLIASLEKCDIFAKRLVETDIKYAGYLERQSQLAERTKRLEMVKLPDNMDYSTVSGLSREVEEKLSKIHPLNLGQAGRISGVTPAAISCLEIHLHKLGILNAR